MKEKLFIFIFLIIFLLALPNGNILTSPVFAQNTASPKNVPRVVLVELFVQEGCLSCPTAEFCLEDLAWGYGTKKLILVEEHLWGDGYDTLETNARYDWYVDVDFDKRGTPDVFVNGLTKRLQGMACDCVEGNYICYKENIDKELTQPPQVELSASNTITKSNYIIEGMVKNISNSFLKNLAICGMIVKEGEESGLCCYVLKIFPFQDIPLFLSGNTFYFQFTSEILINQKTKLEEEKDKLHFVVLIQNLETKKVLQSFYIE
jgi:hypothetical protein